MFSLSTLQDSRGPALPTPQQFYIINSDGSVGNVSVNCSVVNVLQPSRRIKIPLSCGNPLQCIPPQQNGGTSEIYIPNEDNSGLILVEVKGEMVHTYNITTPCVFNDFVLLPNHTNYPLLIACVLTEDSILRYALINRYGNMTEGDSLQRIPGVTALVSPIILTVTGPEENDTTFAIVSISSNENEIVIYDPMLSDGNVTKILSDFSSCIPICIQKLTLHNVFLLTCKESSQYLVNISTRPAGKHCYFS